VLQQMDSLAALVPFAKNKTGSQKHVAKDQVLWEPVVHGATMERNHKPRTRLPLVLHEVSILEQQVMILHVWLTQWQILLPTP